MEALREKYYNDWQDDQTMDVLFSPFRENRDVNPQSWDSKMTFWKDRRSFPRQPRQISILKGGLAPIWKMLLPS